VGENAQRVLAMRAVARLEPEEIDKFATAKDLSPETVAPISATLLGQRKHHGKRYDRSFEELFVVGARRDGGSASRWWGLLEPVDVRRCDGFWHSAAVGQREGAAAVGVLYGRRLDLGNASSR
jgi:hypothetical protein